MNNNISDLFISEIYNLTKKGYIKQDLSKARECFLDYMGVVFAGRKLAEKKMHRLIDNYSIISNNSLDNNQSKGVLLDSFILGYQSHIAELDDGQRVAMMHPGAPIISALLAIAKNNSINGKKFLEAIIIGYEVSLRIARVAQPNLKKLGFHASGVCGTIGAAIAVGVALDYTKEEIKDTFSASIASASGLLVMIDDDSELKPYNIGNAASSAILAAIVGKSGISGPNDVLNSERGFFNMFSREYDLTKLFKKMGETSEIQSIYLKAYASCRHSHPAIEAALIMKSDPQFDIENIESIQISTYDLAVYGHENTNISNTSSAKMSTPYCVAIALLFGKASIEMFSDKYYLNKNVIDLCNKIKISVDDQLSDCLPLKRPAVVKVLTKDGKIFVSRVDYPKGEPENPIELKELKEKFISLATFGGIDFDFAKDLSSTILNLDSSFYNFDRIIKKIYL